MRPEPLIVLLLSFWSFASPLREHLESLENHSIAITQKTDTASLRTLAEKGIGSTQSLESELTKEWELFWKELRVPDSELAALLKSPGEFARSQKPLPATLTVLRAHILQANPLPMIHGLELVAAGIGSLYFSLRFYDGLARSYGSNNLPLVEFDQLLKDLHERLALLSALYPEFPDVQSKNLFTPKQHTVQKLFPLLSVFSPVTPLPLPGSSFTEITSTLKLTEPMVRTILNAVSTIERTVTIFEDYHLRHFPQNARSAALEHLAVAIYSVGGLRECVNLARSGVRKDVGLSDFEGEPCDFTAFSSALQKYTQYYESHTQWTVLPVLEEFFLTAKENGLELGTTKAEIPKLLLGIPGLEPYRSRIQQVILGRDEAITKWMAETNPLVLNAELKQALEAILPTGFDVDYSENLNQARHLLKNLALFDATSITHIDSQTECTAFLNQSKTMDRVLSVIRETESTSAAQSADSFIRASPLYQVRITSLNTQNPELSGTTLSGLMQSTAVTQLTANYVQTQLLLGVKPIEALQDLGVTPTPEMEYVRKGYELHSIDHGIGQALELSKPMTDSQFRHQYRKRLLEAAEQIRKLDDWVRRLNTRGEAARLAPSGLAKILNIAEGFTGENDRKNRTAYNQALIDLVEYVRWDYVVRHNPGKTREELQRINSHTRLTIDQFNEQVSWYSGIENGRITRPPRYTSFIGHEELKLLQVNPILQGLLMNHVHEVLDGPREYAEFTRDFLILHYPMLTHVDPKSSQVTALWRTYRDSDYERVLGLHLKMIQNSLSAITQQQSPEKFLNTSIFNRSLLDFVLRRYPTLKLSSCRQIQRVDAESALNRKAIAGLSVLALSLSLVPEVGTTAAFIPGAIAAYMSYREKTKAQIAAAMSHAYQITSLAQRSQNERRFDDSYQHSLASDLLDAQVDHALSIAALATSGGIRFGRMTKVLGSFNRSLRYCSLRTAGYFKTWKAATLSPLLKPVTTNSRLFPFAARLVQISQKAGFATRNALLFPFHRLGLTAPWTYQWRLFSQLSQGLTRTQRTLLRTWYGIEDGAHLVGNLPVALAGSQWGTGAAARYVGFYGAYELTNWAIHSWRNYRFAAREVLLEQLWQDEFSSDPVYQDLFNAIYEGSLTMDEAARVLEHWRKLGVNEALSSMIEKLGNKDAREELLAIEHALSTSPQSEDPTYEFAKQRALREVREYLEFSKNGFDKISR